MTKFWLVWCENGGIPTRKHGTKKEAVAEAERLSCQAHLIGKRFVVLEALGSCLCPVFPPEWERCQTAIDEKLSEVDPDSDDEMPF